MIPDRSAIEKAHTGTEVLGRLSEFLSYLDDCRVDSVLPISLNELSAHDVADVRGCMARLQQTRQSHCPLTAAGKYWMDQLDEMFKAASWRLDQLKSPTAEQHRLS